MKTSLNSCFLCWSKMDLQKILLTSSSWLWVFFSVCMLVPVSLLTGFDKLLVSAGCGCALLTTTRHMPSTLQKVQKRGLRKNGSQEGITSLLPTERLSSALSPLVRRHRERLWALGLHSHPSLEVAGGEGRVLAKGKKNSKKHRGRFWQSGFSSALLRYWETGVSLALFSGLCEGIKVEAFASAWWWVCLGAQNASRFLLLLFFVIIIIRAVSFTH